MSQKIIYHITRSFTEKKYGGIETVINEISKNSIYKHEILSVGSKKTKKKYSNKLLSRVFNQSFTLFGDVFSFGLLSFLYKNKHKVKILHLHYPHILGFLYLIFYVYKKKTIVTHHSDIMRQKFIKKIIISFQFLFNFFVDKYHISSKTYFNNSEIKNYKHKTLIEFFSIKKIKIKKTLSKKYILFIARPAYYKGFNHFYKLVKDLEDIHFICISNFKFKNIPKNLTIKKNVTPIMKNKLIANARLIISTSTNRAESYGMSLLEGLMYCVPLISFDLQTGVNEIVKNNYNGYLIKKFNLIDFKKKIRKIYYNNKLYNELKKNSLFHKKKFETNYSNLEKLYRSFIL